MVIVWGTKVRYTTHTTGEFFCPDCGGDRAYRKQVARRWNTVFWLPVIPRRRAWWVVQCAECDHRFRPSVLAKPTSAHMARMLQGAVRALVVHLLRACGDQGDPLARQIAVDSVRTVRDEGYDEATLDEDICCIPNEPDVMLAQIADHLDSAGREAMLVRGVRVALADGPLNTAELTALQSVGRALQMTPAHVQGVLVTVGRSVDNS